MSLNIIMVNSHAVLSTGGGGGALPMGGGVCLQEGWSAYRGEGVCLQGEGSAAYSLLEGGWATPPSPGTRKADGMHSSGMLSCYSYIWGFWTHISAF